VKDQSRVLAGIRVSLGILSVAKGVAFWWAGVDWIVAMGWIGLSLCVVVGLRSRLAAVALVGAGAVLFTSGHGSNQFFLQLLLFVLIIASDCERHFALWPGKPGPLGVAAPLFLMRCQLSIVYGFAAIAKINESWMSGAALEFFFQRAMWNAPAWFLHVAPVLATGVVLMELALALAPWVAEVRRSALIGAAILHAGMLPVAVSWINLLELLIFAGTMFSLFAAFLAKSSYTVWAAGPSLAVK
jgi:hypothetical protein